VPLALYGIAPPPPPLEFRLLANPTQPFFRRIGIYSQKEKEKALKSSVLKDFQ
jgi:hypothetical protein